MLALSRLHRRVSQSIHRAKFQGFDNLQGATHSTLDHYGRPLEANSINKSGCENGVPIQVLLTEMYPKARRELCDLLSSQGFQMVADVMDNLSAVRLVKKCQPDIVILDAGGKFPAGLNAAREILHWNRNSRIIFLSLHSEVQYMRAAFRCGVRGYVLKTRAVAELGQAILEVSKGGIYLSKGMRSLTLNKHLLENE